MGTHVSSWTQNLVVGNRTFFLWGNPLPDERAEWYVRQDDDTVARGERGSKASAMHTAEAVARALAAGAPPPPAGAKAVDAPCPRCDVTALHIEEKMRAQSVGEFSLSGMQMKASAGGWPYLVCRACSAQAPAARVEDGEGVYDPAAMARP